MHDIKEIAGLFDMRADFVHAHPYGSGHINDTYCAYYDQAGQRIRYIHQRLSTEAFKKPIELMENVDRVTTHALDELLKEGNPEARRRTLTCIPSMQGTPHAIDAAGNCWRTYPFIERARTYDTIESEAQATEAARAFGEFQKLAATLPGDPLHETIPGFHNTKQRFQHLVEAIEADTENRAASVQKEIDWYMARQEEGSKVVDMLESGELPLRVTHNDTKLNNVMLDDVTGEGICVIDLDTTMPGSAIYDFGDMVRTATSPAAEDEKDVSKVEMRMFMFDALVKGYLASAGEFLTDNERSLLAFSGKLLTMECGTRFLTDYLKGDVYFKVHRDGHNVDRTRTQIALCESIDAQMAEMEALVAKYSV
ncbi:aminoglycoside phosphotransferase family protein [Verrucomicrobiaceae bacterium N1E253]|uniref:Aminoglycoside phosphotransferase family protein n=1 Tax=Oceaniferula marina TaxID=2748318 RepID=A0A851GQY4_9BACT|nr:aminoglycoside phosphotransferase family protein [Oceaniferula marina]NWK57220.1 aminoglycoside phosphotransferase family protein [Oceaniferula marina]